MRAIDHIEVPDGFTDKVRRIAKRIAKIDPVEMTIDDFLTEQHAIGEEFNNLFRRWP